MKVKMSKYSVFDWYSQKLQLTFFKLKLSPHFLSAQSIYQMNSLLFNNCLIIFCFMNSQKKKWANNRVQPEIDQIRFNSEQAFFCYRPSKKYIQLTQIMITQPSIYYFDYHTRILNSIVNSFLLDQGLSVIQQTHQYKENLEHKLEQYSKKKGQQIFLSFLTQVYDIPEISLDPIPYIKYPELNDFQIKRAGFGRCVQTYKIRSDAISRDHCEIVRIKSCSKRVLDRQKTLYNIFTKKTPLKSKFRQLPKDIWQKIFQYSQPVQRYLIRDCGSRNGTYIHERGSWNFQLNQNFEYQIDGESYGIQINKIFTSADTPNQTILEHNTKVSKMIDQYMKQVSWCYYESAKKSLLVPEKDIKNNDKSKFMVLVFKLKTRQPHQYYFIGMAEDCEKRFSVGCHQEIDVYPEQYDNPSLHAWILFKDGKWMIEAVPLSNWGSQNNQIISDKKYKKIWVKPPKDKCYYFNTSKSYKFRLGFSNMFELQFHNF